MKLVFSLIFYNIVFLSTAQNLQKQNKTNSLIFIIYSSFGMDGGFNVEINKDEIIYNRRDTIKISSKDWNGLIKISSSINLRMLSTYQAPTNSRAVDGAWYAKLMICKNNAVFSTQDFDEGYPMKEIVPLISRIDKIINRDRHLIKK